MGDTYNKLTKELSVLKKEIHSLKTPTPMTNVLGEHSPSKENQIEGLKDSYNFQMLDNIEVKLNECLGLASTSKENVMTPASPRDLNDSSVHELETNLKAKDDEVKALWNVIKEMNKNKGGNMDMN